LYKHNYTNTTDATDRVALLAGVTQDCGAFYQQTIASALAHGAVSEYVVRNASYFNFLSMMRLGFFDKFESTPWRYVVTFCVFYIEMCFCIWSFLCVDQKSISFLRELVFEYV